MSAIVVLGSCSIDLVVQQPRLAHPGETIFGSGFMTVPGGKGLNQAIAAARAGGDVAFLGGVGRDPFGDRVRAQLRDDGIDTDQLIDVEVATGTAHIAVLDGGENAIVVVPGANAAITRLNDASRAAIASASFLVTQFERPIGLIHESFILAREHRVATVLTPAPVVEFDRTLLSLVDILVLNAAEACELVGVADECEAAIALSRHVGAVVLTRGARGCLLARDGLIETEFPARRVDPLDTTAAGDTFVGALVAWLAADADLDESVRAATAAASISVTRLGASSSIPHRHEIARILSG